MSTDVTAIKTSQTNSKLTENKRKSAKTEQTYLIGSSDFWRDSILETNEKLPYETSPPANIREAIYMYIYTNLKRDWR
jgi:hypothetical protein